MANDTVIKTLVVAGIRCMVVLADAFTGHSTQIQQRNNQGLQFLLC